MKNEMYERALGAEGDCQSSEWPMWMAQMAIAEQTKRVADALERQNELLASTISTADRYFGRPMSAFRTVEHSVNFWKEDRDHK